MQLQDYNTYFRTLTSEPNNTGRWSDAAVASLINQSRYSFNMEVDWGTGTVIVNTVVGQQEYLLPAFTKVLRVKLAGQILIRTDIPTLEGDQIELYDNNSQTALGTPQWNSATAITYPQTNTSYSGYPYPSSLPFFQGQRAEYYLRDNSYTIGIVPPPAGVYVLSVDVLPFPNTLVSLTDVDALYDFHFLEVITQGAVMRALQSDKDIEGRTAALAAYTLELKRIRGWINDLQPGTPQGIVPITYRGLFQNNGCDE